MKLTTVAEMRSIEEEANANGISYQVMMENAGQGLGKWINDSFHGKGWVVGLIGSGNNGGDTLIALDFLKRMDWDVCAYLVRPRPEDDPLVLRLKAMKAAIVNGAEDPKFSELENQIGKAQVLLDGVLGTGFELPLKKEVARILAKVKELVAVQPRTIHCIAVDCPSGVDCETGKTASECIPAEATICMAAVKTGLLAFPAYIYVGQLHVVDIGLPKTLESFSKLLRMVVDQESVRNVLPERKLDAHKGTFGTAMVAAGSINYTGAALLAGKAAYRVGAGLVTMAVPELIHNAIAGQFPEATWLMLSHDQGVISEKAASVFRDHLSRVTSLLIGPGWGLEDTTLNFLKKIIGAEEMQIRANSLGFLTPAVTNKDRVETLPPLVIDADGLKLLARIPDWPKLIPRPTILTPHPGEMSILCGQPIERIQADRLNIAERYAHEWGHVVVLKGAFTVIANPDGKTAVIPVATPALARAGTGDVLSGIITGLRAQGMEAFEAAYSGAWIHAQAGLGAKNELGNTASVIAGDVLQAVIGVMSRLLN